MTANPQSTATAAEAAGRARQALQLRINGATFTAIAETLDVSPSTAHKYVARALADIPRAEADELRTLECQRLDALQRAHWEMALAGDAAATDRVIRIIDRRAKLLGLDAPQQVEIAGADVDLDATVNRLLAVAATLTATPGADNA